jgi:protein-S-isoprenylcysteine O-methyltransferase Ste14
MGLMALVYGSVCYLAFLSVFSYLVVFTGDLGTWRSVSRGPGQGGAGAWGVDLLLLGLFAVQHSLMARPGFKRIWQRLVAPCVERSTYVLLSSLALALLFWRWRPLPGVVWDPGLPGIRLALLGVFWAGVALSLYSTFLISHADLFGLRQVWFRFRGQPCPERPLSAGTLYGRVRHPLMLGFLLVLWAAPRMTLGHLLFAGAMTLYILVGTCLEERDLLKTQGPAYEAYRRRVPKFLPRLRRR